MSNPYTHSSQLNNPNNKGAYCFFLVFVPLTFVLVILAITIALFLALKRDYKEWQINFESRIGDNQILELADETRTWNLRESIDAKIAEFSSSKEEIDHVEFTVEEIEFMLAEKISSSLPEGLEVNRIYIDAADGEWVVYLKIATTAGNELPWLAMKIRKADFESPKLTVRSISIGGFDFADYGLGFIVDDVNSGYTEALNLVNENEFTGRRYENIELEDDQVIIKGRANH